MKILVTGDRNWFDYGMIKAALMQNHLEWTDQVAPYFHEVTVIHGAARGADRLAGYAAKSLGMQVHEYPADWVKNGRAAGPIRNQQMLDSEEGIDLVLAFHDNLGNSKGTKDMVERAKKAGLKVIHYSHESLEGVVQ